jgi:hypothetical protein
LFNRISWPVNFSSKSSAQPDKNSPRNVISASSAPDEAFTVLHASAEEWNWEDNEYKEEGDYAMGGREL